MTDSTPPEENLETPAAPRGVLAALDELLRRPAALVVRAKEGEAQPFMGLLVGAIGCFLVYGAASGFFQGGEQILVTTLKAPLIIFASLLLCVPSFYVFSALGGIEVSPRWLATAALGLAGMLGLLLASLMPVIWLFSVSSASLPFVVFLHFTVWLVALAFGYRFLHLATDQRCGGRLVTWTILLLVVSLQVSSQMRPVLYRPAQMELFAPQKIFFMEHVARILDQEPKRSQQLESDS